MDYIDTSYRLWNSTRSTTDGHLQNYNYNYNNLINIMLNNINA